MASSKPSSLETVKLGMTDLEVSPIAFGTWQLGGEWGQFDRNDAVAAAHVDAQVDPRRAGIRILW
jgi:aryl-alcohol dehydrogenase-like predicted oxidoreductase